MEFDSRGVALGFLGAAAVLGALLWFVGFAQIRQALALLSAQSLLLIVGAGLCWLGSWGLTLRQVLDSLDVRTSVPKAILLYASAAFANNITPFGQAGGEPFSALLISRATDSKYETGLAAIASVDTLNFIPSIALATIGMAYYVTMFAVGDSILLVAGIVGTLAVGIPILGYLLWTNREAVKHGIARVLAPTFATLGGVVPGVPSPTRKAIRGRVGAFFGAVERVGQKREDLATAVLCSALGWLFMCLALYFSLRALVPGNGIPVFIVFIVVPVATIASILPLPGGAGGVETAIVLLLVPTTGITAATATSAAIVYRGGTYWLSTLLGGIAAAVLEGPDVPWRTSEE
ncbi:lysylphosphatidylglycerol synthase transmembrane domain-containing protein [Halospeciosus flavus]|uniref:YbhN family protein n=1 Tax=Halospeciosus flavus TaxID=3032283 RepID=A0ABD5Z857_9EURY|nr:lysylphosphatidylglycerol synthase transmembrane domain-containing protein [Halospeciosus flavus]